MIWKLTCGVEVLINEDDYNKIDKTGWYLSDEFHGKDNRKTRYVVHDKYGRLHRYILGINKNEKKNLIVDHIDRNGLNNQRSNLRITDTSTNKKNQSVIKSNQLNFNGVSLEYNKSKDYFRFRVSYSETPCSQKTKSFSFGQFKSPKDALKKAILFRIQKMKENGYLLDERSTTIENELINNTNSDIEQLLGINLKELIVSKVGSSESKWT
jgi:hypothetical protein